MPADSLSRDTIRCRVTGRGLAMKEGGGMCLCSGNECRAFPAPKPVHRALPPDCSSDMHQLIAKAIYLRFAAAYSQGGLTISRAELAAAGDAEFGYAIDNDTGALLFRPLTEAEKEI